MRQPFFLLCGAVIVGALLVMWWADTPDFLRGRGHQAESSHLDGQSAPTTEKQEHQNKFTVGRTERGPAWMRPESWFPTDEPRAVITFGRLMSDAEVLSWLEAHDVEPRAFHMRSPGGFSGTHRLMEDPEKSFEEVIAEARAQAIDNFANSLESHPLRFQGFAEQYREGEVSTNVNLEKAARSLLTLRSAMEDAHAHAVRGDPLIHAIEIAGAGAQFVPQEGGPADFGATISDTDPDTRTRVPNPFGEEPAYTDPLVDAMDSTEVYEAIAEAGETAPDVLTGTAGLLHSIR